MSRNPMRNEQNFLSGSINDEKTEIDQDETKKNDEKCQL